MEENGTAVRPISKDILDNKGLVPSRKKEVRNPRRRHREKFAKVRSGRLLMLFAVQKPQLSMMPSANSDDPCLSVVLLFFH